MRRWARIGIRSVLPILSAVLFGTLALVYLSSRGAADGTFHFLAGRELLHQNTCATYPGRETVAVYCFFAYRDRVYDAAREELRALGYVEMTPPIDDSSSDSWNRGGTSRFLKQDRASILIQVGTGRFLGEQLGGNLSFSNEMDWVNVVIRKRWLPFSLRRELRYWWDQMSGKNPPQLRPPTAQPKPA